MLTQRASRPAVILAATFVASLFTASSANFFFPWFILAGLATVYLGGLPRLPGFSPLLLVVVLFVALMLGNQWFISPVRDAHGVFQALILGGAFFVAARLHLQDLADLFHLLLLLMCLLAAWGLAQHMLGIGELVDMGRRANAAFYTPNTFAAALNLFLVPSLVLYLARGNRMYLAAAVLLFAALLATASRGGMAAFLAGSGMVAALMFWHRSRLSWHRLALLAIGFASVFGLLQLVAVFSAEPALTLSYRVNEIGTGFDGVRLGLYQLAMRLIAEAPYSGHGFWTFAYLLQEHHPQELIRISTAFVHNDYLQLWVELGVLAPICLLLMFAMLLHSAVARGGGTGLRLWQLALSGALATLFAHALVDFTFYPVPLVLCLGLALGTTHQLMCRRMHYCRVASRVVSPAQRFLRLRRQARTVLVGAVLIWQLQPMLAQSASDNATRALKRAQVDEALDQYALARWFAPHEPFYYWAAGRILRDQAVARNDAGYAVAALKMLQQGSELHRWETQNLREWVRLARDYPQLAGVPDDTLLTHSAALLARAPGKLSSHIEHLRTLTATGNSNRAGFLLLAMFQRFPNDETVQQLKAQFERNGLLGSRDFQRL